jgi:hypothetical protein
VSAQDLSENETTPNWHSNAKKGQFDASLEEVLHLITHVGCQNAYPAFFGESPGTKVANEMDGTCGVQFFKVSKNTPPIAGSAMMVKALIIPVQSQNTCNGH